MTTILRFILFFLLVPAFAIVAQAAEVFQDDFRIVDADSRNESIILESIGGVIYSYDSSGALLQQHKSIDGEDCSSGYQKLKTSGAEQPLFSFFAELVATNKLKTASPGDFTRTHGLSGRASSRNVRNIAEDMKANGYQGAPIKVLEANGERFILDGHHRVQAARRAGIDVPFESVSPSNLSNFGYNSVDDVIRASTEAGPVKLRP